MSAGSAMNPAGVESTESEHLPWLARETPPPVSTGAFLADTATELLRTIAEVLDIRTVFPRVSDIVQQVLTHDALALKFCDRSGHATLEARSTEDLPAEGWSVRADDREFSIVTDLRR